MEVIQEAWALLLDWAQKFPEFLEYLIKLI